jgi:protease-4
MIRTFFKFIFRVFFWLCALLGLNVVALILFVYFLGLGPFAPAHKTLEKDSVLVLTLNGSYVEYADASGLEALLLGKNASLYHLRKAIRHAAQDDKIKGLALNLETPLLGPAQIQELRDALLVFRASGKPSWCYCDTFGELSSGTALYYLATACEEIWLQPVGTVNLTGLEIEVPFAKGALETLDVKPEIAQRKEYKSYVEMFTRDDFSEPNREALQAVLDSILSQFVDGIAQERDLSHDQVRLLIQNGPYLTKEAQAATLVDRVDYRQNLVPTIRAKLGENIEIVGIKAYLEFIHQEVQGDRIALIFGQGTITRDGEANAWNEVGITSNAAYKAFQLAINDKDVKAIVYRINSGGGSPTASETIYSIINYAKEHGNKPVIISMSDAAASGGYWIAVAGTKIVAQPATITGSIGVFGGKFDLSGLFDKVGIKWGHISTSENGGMGSETKPYTPANWIKLNAEMDQIYDHFTNLVAKGRNMSLEQVEKVARGRVWTGEQAIALGLVDQLGGLEVAFELARAEAKLSPDAGVQVFPPRKTFIEHLVSLFEEDHDEWEEFSQPGVLGVVLRPFKKIMGIFNVIFSSQERVYTPLGEVK